MRIKNIVPFQITKEGNWQTTKAVRLFAKACIMYIPMCYRHI
jgi:hypothetical protein